MKDVAMMIGLAVAGIVLILYAIGRELLEVAALVKWVMQ